MINFSTWRSSAVVYFCDAENTVTRPRAPEERDVHTPGYACMLCVVLMARLGVSSSRFMTACRVHKTEWYGSGNVAMQKHEKILLWEDSPMAKCSSLTSFSSASEFISTEQMMSHVFIHSRTNFRG